MLDGLPSNNSAPSDFPDACTPKLSRPEVDASVEMMFPGSGGKAFAGWYTGDLICNYGLVLEYRGTVSEAANICENKLLIRVVRGYIMSIGVVKFVSNLRSLFGRLRFSDSLCRGAYEEKRAYKKGDRGLEELLEKHNKKTLGIAGLKEVEDEINVTKAVLHQLRATTLE